MIGDVVCLKYTSESKGVNVSITVHIALGLPENQKLYLVIQINELPV